MQSFNAKKIFFLLVIPIFLGCKSSKFFEKPYSIYVTGFDAENLSPQKNEKSENNFTSNLDLTLVAQDFFRTKINFSFLNESEKTITEFSIRFSVLDDEGNELFSGSEDGDDFCDFSVQFVCEILPHECVDFSFFVADFLPSEIEDDWSLSNFYAEKIKFSDGTKWQDRFGIFSNIF